ncbi:MAG TPA: hypothetical protein VEX12_07620, partial [Microbacterium sp.]|nr:hypothetical protein [Microbacterium sp.]
MDQRSGDISGNPASDRSGESTRSTGSSSSTERLVVPDVLRGVAILAMLIAHAMPLLMITARPVRFVVGNISDLAS